MSTKYGSLTIICNGCGEAMMECGLWPSQFPKDDNGFRNVQQATRYSCKTCRTPHEKYDKGLPVMVAILEAT